MVAMDTDKQPAPTRLKDMGTSEDGIIRPGNENIDIKTKDDIQSLSESPYGEMMVVN